MSDKFTINDLLEGVEKLSYDIRNSLIDLKTALINFSNNLQAIGDLTDDYCENGNSNPDDLIREINRIAKENCIGGYLFADKDEAYPYSGNLIESIIEFLSDVQIATVIWIEVKEPKSFYPVYYIGCELISNPSKLFQFYNVKVVREDGFTASYALQYYNYSWRAWRFKPTDEERNLAPWKEGEKES